MKPFKTYFVPAHLRFDVNKLRAHAKKLPDSVGLVTTIQYIEQLDEVSKLLKAEGIECQQLGQILGCNWENTKKSDRFKAFLYVGSGRFHPVGLGLITDKEIYTYNPQTDIFGTLDRADVSAYQKRKKGRIVKFLSSTNIGVLISVKEGQMNIHAATHIEQKFPDKNVYMFACNTLDYSELENYPFIDTWVNTMCPRIGTDDHFKVPKGMINIVDLREYLK